MSAVSMVVMLSGIVSLASKCSMPRTQFSTTSLGQVCNRQTTAISSKRQGYPGINVTMTTAPYEAYPDPTLNLTFKMILTLTLTMT